MLAIAANVQAFVLLGIGVPTARLTVTLINTAKLPQTIRITNVDGRYSAAPIAQMLMLAAA